MTDLRRAEVEPRAAALQVPQPHPALPRAATRRDVPWRGILFAGLALVYLLVTLGVIFRSPILSLDTDLVKLDLRHRFPEWRRPILDYVTLGQRKPAFRVFLPFFLWVAWRKRSTTPLVTLATAVMVLNLSVGIVKVATGRLGPLSSKQAHDVFVGGNIYPSGHVSNTVVLYGLMALFALRFRRLGMAAAVFLSVSVGLGTVYLDTHWFSDVLGGWIAGALVLLALPSIMPTVQHWMDKTLAVVQARRERRIVAMVLVGIFSAFGFAWVYLDMFSDIIIGSVFIVGLILLALPTLVPFVRERLRRRQAAPAQPQGKVTPVSDSAFAQSFVATAWSLDAAEDPTRRGLPRISAGPSGP